VGHDLKFESTGGKMMLAPHSARRDATRRMSATELVCAAPSQQRLRRSSDPSQLRRSSAARSISSVAAASARRDAQNERDGAGLRISVAAATPSQLHRAHHERSTGHRAEQPLGKICQKQGDTTTTTTTQPCFFNIILPKELRPLPCSGIFFFWVILLLKRAVFG